MQIHVVRAGESLWGIAQAYGTTVQRIVDANQIPEPDQLVVGQALVIPIVGSFYYVQPGDSLWSIGQRFGINYLTLAQVNGIHPNQILSVGLRLYIPQPPKTTAETLAYLEPRGTTVSDALLEQAREAGPYLTYLALFSYEVKRDGSLQRPPSQGITQITNDTGASLAMVISNLEDFAFSGELARDIFQSTAVQDLLFDNIVAEAKRLGSVKDIHFDFENLPTDQRQAYNNFLRRAVEKFHAQGYTVSTALAPKTRDDTTGQWTGAHDYQAHGEIVDFVLLMTYEWGYSAGPPMAVSPLPEVEAVVKYAVSEIPAHKIMLGQNLYGYDWTLPFVQGGPYAEALSPQRAIEVAKRYHAAIQFDWRAQAPFFEYYDEQGRAHIVWFEDARSIQAKFNLIKQYNLRGIGYWKLGLPFPQNWLLIGANFDVVKK
ncbi:glycoside hydrolase family 18 protein [Lysinibacillus macroides]|uniref:Spore gernimation protein n=1 Tax=Lysinibacillus macroides TaxID=33935 RepID=A0A0M9DJX8_9BACI|nr:glycoside hydrolase family 18 protein [Lysinibacillus macroides]KOY81712.1 spore gernimation protein [Lysinibacillus macroides]QPR70492.1 glycoside hydrolase family 18 protein [Lysinibacillus macroides]